LSFDNAIIPFRAVNVAKLSAEPLETFNCADGRRMQVQLVTQVFKSKQGTKYAGWPVYGDLRHYSVQIERHGKKIKIIFVPDEPRLKPNEAGTGGSTNTVGKFITSSRSIG
jgi:hypothetical protein